MKHCQIDLASQELFPVFLKIFWQAHNSCSFTVRVIGAIRWGEGGAMREFRNRIIAASIWKKSYSIFSLYLNTIWADDVHSCTELQNVIGENSAYHLLHLLFLSLSLSLFLSLSLSLIQAHTHTCMYACTNTFSFYPFPRILEMF